MKIRYGFVSNSSSSSFLVAFPRNLKCAKDVQDMVFGDETLFLSPYGEDYWSAEQVASKIWNDIKNQIPNNRKSFMNRMYNVLIDRYDDFKIKKEDSQYDWDYDFDDEAYDGANKEAVEKFMLDNSSCFFYCVEYSDNGEGPLGSAMEHGNLFKKLQHLVSSHH